MRQYRKQGNRGYLALSVLVFGTVFILLFTSLIGSIVSQNQLMTQRINLQTASQVAEAGLDYYKWYVAHNPNDVTFGTGSPGPHTFAYTNSLGEAIGEYSLTIDSNQLCGVTNSLQVTSVGRVFSDPDLRAEMSARYSRPTVADYAFILNSSVWAGADRVITGPYHSNGGIRMDGRNQSLVTSNVANWLCTPTFGCTPTTTRNGVFTTTTNANTALFSFPSPPINFAGITVDLNSMKDRAQNGGGLYFGPSGQFGYRAQFNANGTVTVSRVQGTAQMWGFSSENGWQQERPVITSTQTVGTFPIPANCPVVFFEDTTWVQGTIRDKVTMVAANLITPSSPRSIMIQDNISYVSATSSGFLAVSQQDVLLGVNIPNDITINGIFIAQNGRYGRNFYCNNTAYCTSSQRLPGAYLQFAIRNSETVNGTIVSNGRVGTQWTSGGTTVSGFLNRNNSYDRILAADPPPLAPVTSDVFRFREWRQE